MNALLLLVYLCSSIMLIFKAPESLLTTIMQGCENTLKFLPVLFCSYALFIPLTKILEKGKVDGALQRALNPVNKRLFPKENEVAYKHLSVNISTNLLGIGGASTPSGILAIENMKSRKNKLMLVVMNSLSIQLIPTTVLALRAGSGGKIDVILPTLIATTFTSVLGIILVKVFVKE